VRPRTKYAIRVGAIGVWIACVVPSIVLACNGHPSAGAVCSLASIPSLLVLMWTDRR
jgi:hypothetical protein